jgi:hypothetical protein
MTIIIIIIIITMAEVAAVAGANSPCLSQFLRCSSSISKKSCTAVSSDGSIVKLTDDDSVDEDDYVDDTMLMKMILC